MSTALFEDLTILLEVMMVNQALVTAAKFGFQRPYPHRYLPENTTEPQPLDFLSFYSGHTSTVVSFLSAYAMTVQYREGQALWPWIFTAVAGSSVAHELVKAGEHYPTDVIVGALVGTGIGIAIPALHHRNRNEETPYRIEPIASAQGFGLRWKLNF